MTITIIIESPSELMSAAVSSHLCRPNLRSPAAAYLVLQSSAAVLDITFVNELRSSDAGEM